MKKQAFTLVELIVVITILAILGTIAFINLQGYSTSARDSKRLSDINNIQKKVSIELVKGESLGNLINTLKINSGLTIDNNPATSIQGTANFQTLKENGDNFKDPLTKGDYIISYSVGGNGTGTYKFTQISTINEENNQEVIEGNYYKMQLVDSPSIIKDNVGNFIIDGGLHVLTVTYTVLDCKTSGEILVGTSIYGSCDTNDIIVCSGTSIGYTISACNEGVGIAGTGTGSYGNYFQWGRNKGFAYTDISQELETLTGSIGLNALTDSYGFVWKLGLAYPYSWANTDITGNWGEILDNPLGTNISARQGPCLSGYHVPSNEDWSGITIAGGFGSNGADMQAKLKLPYSGYRNRNSGTFFSENSYGYYWSSSTLGTHGYNMYFNYNSISPSYNFSRGAGFSVRCFKN